MSGSAWAAFQALPPGAQVNDDPAAGIDPGRAVGTESPTNADVVGGALTAGAPAVPWTDFRQTTTGADQIFSRSFAAGAWKTRGAGTVGGRSSAAPTFSGSLNFDQTKDGEAPAIDFAGTGRTVPWATWYEDTTGTGFNAENIFASRFDNAQNKWIFAGQGRGLGGGTVPVPSLNIHTNQVAKNPSVAGGSAADPTKPGPWVTWQEADAVPGYGTHNQIFIELPKGPGEANCDGVKPLGVADGSGHVPAVGGFCWQQVGVDRVGSDPSLNVDPTRGDPAADEGGIEPDIAFTGKSDGVPWVVWYENGSTALGLHTNEMVFAAKGVADANGDGGFHWQVVGQPGGGGVLDTSGANHFGACAESQAAEAACSLNKNAANDAEDPRVAAGTMTPGAATTPWVTWDETVGGVDQIFVARLVGGDHFELANNGQPISLGSNPSTRPDITFSGNTPYVSWRENTGGGVDKAFYGHVVNAANPTFVLDNGPVDITPSSVADVREPISSSCIATPFNGDGSACQGDSLGTPFFLTTSGNTPKLLADGYQTDAPATGTASAVGTSSALVSGAVNPQGGPVKVRFDFGTSRAYGQTTAAQRLGPANAATAFAAELTGLPAATTIHYRAVAITDFGTIAGDDRTLTTAPASSPPPPADTTPPHVKLKISHTTIRKLLKAKRLTINVTADEASTIRLAATTKAKVKHKTQTVSLAKATVKLTKAGSTTASLKLTAAGRSALRHLRRATIRVTATATDQSRNASTAKTSATFKR